MGVYGFSFSLIQIMGVRWIFNGLDWLGKFGWSHGSPLFWKEYDFMILVALKEKKERKIESLNSSIPGDSKCGVRESTCLMARHKICNTKPACKKIEFNV